MTWKKQAVVTAAAVLLLAPVAVAGDRYDDFEDTHSASDCLLPGPRGRLFA